ncbi:hypothetical protein H6G36_03830 [Anabaena minutissima FACHB-250]|nr:hypothetical protein [Anabaena minutissima FACHB-250]
MIKSNLDAFALSGYWNNIHAGKNFFQSGGLNQNNTSELLRSQRLLKVDIHPESPELLHSFITGGLNPISSQILKKLIETDQEPYLQIDHTTPEMRVALKPMIYY